ncbi:MAG: DNA gyrase inhibitor YacG [Deltaproteobacteria bacterium]|nr:DNA gyrase inhibitor YacG [Deltaproteobacteria bacterium]
MTRKMKCPTCRKDVEWQGNLYRPFCSARCKTTDLGAWASDSYRIPGEKLDSGEQDADDESS